MGVFNCQRNKIRSEVKVEVYKMGVVETRFAELIWSHEPINSGGLVKLAQEELGWKKSTTYTVIKKLCGKGIIKNEDSMVSSVLSKEQYFARQSRHFVEETFDGSLPRFLAAFAREEKLSQEEILQIRRLIDEL